MAATSKHYGDVFNWILKLIESCTRIEQMDGIYVIYNKFCSIYQMAGYFDQRFYDAYHNKQRELCQ